MTVMQLFLGSLVVHLAGAFLPLAAGRNNHAAHRLGAAGSIAGACCGIAGALQGITQGSLEHYYTYWESAGLPVSLNLDGLAFFFLLPVFFLVLICSLYALRYLEFPVPGFQAARHWFHLNILVISMAMVVAAADALTFIIAWEMMALSSFMLIITDTQNEKVRRAAGFYLIATHLGTAFLFPLFLIGYHWSGSLDFTSFASWQSLPQPVALLLFVLALIGFGAKAGVFPLHSWLPDAHAAAPSHVSALMSGIMIKTSIYALFRIITFLPALSPWNGLVVMILGICSALFGIAMASMQTDIKRSLAYSTVENIGIIFSAIGLWLYCSSNGNTVAAQFALAGALLHLWNHSLFKSLLFLGSGAVFHASGTREMSMLGGLMQRMPFTGALMVTGAAAVSALPPLNGFVSELLIYLGLFHAGQAAAGGQAVLFMLFAALLALVGGMVVLTMTRIMGIIFGGEPRSLSSEAAGEVPASMIAAMTLAAFFCFAVGIFPRAALTFLAAPFKILIPGSPPLNTIISLPFGPEWNLGALIMIVAIATVTVLRYRSHRPSSASTNTWGCGFIKPISSMAYTAGSYAQLVQDELYCSCIRPSVPHDPEMVLFPVKKQFRLYIGDLILDRLFFPLFVHTANAASSFRRLQAGRMNIYLTYIFLTTIILLCWNYFLL